MKIVGLFDIDEFIKINQTGEVTSAAMYRSTNQFNPDGLFSERYSGKRKKNKNIVAVISNCQSMYSTLTSQRTLSDAVVAS